MREEATIEMVVKSGLCTGCGTCLSLCPSKAIDMSIDNREGIYVPKLHVEKCNGCGICGQVCPGLEIESGRLGSCVDDLQSIESKTVVNIGPNIACYFGHSTDHNIRYNASSGGLVTTLLIFALEKGLIDGALVTKMDENKPLRPKPFLACTRDEIIDASKSKYCPVPANIVLEEVLRKNGKYAVVGLPCHLNGAKKSEKVKKELEKRIVLHFGLFCSHNNSFHQTEYFLHSLKIKPKDVKKISYRGKGWPGLFSVELKSGESLQVPYLSWAVYHEYSLFAPTRCLVCCDGTAQLSDISFGDAWFPEIVGREREGQSVIISRTRKGEELLQLAVESGAITLTNVSSSALAILQKRAQVRRNGIKAKLLYLRLLGKQLPMLEMPVARSTLSDYIRPSVVFLNKYFASNKCLWGTLETLLRLEQPVRKLTEASATTDRYSRN